MQATLKQKLVDMIKSTPVLMFSKTTCPYCEMAKDMFKSADIKYDVHELDKLPEGADMQNTLQEITGQRTVPNIFIGGTHIGGFTDLSAKIKNGVAINLLDEHGIHYNL